MKTMRTMRTPLTVLLLLVAVCVLATSSPRAAWAQPARQPSLEGFVPAEELGNAEQIPAVPLVLTAYGLVWVGVLFYVWLTWRRIGRVETELRQLAGKTKNSP
jgi:CcmD family protein